MAPNMAAKSIYVTSYTKTLTLTAAPFLFILVDALFVFEFPMVPGVYILKSSILKFLFVFDFN